MILLDTCVIVWDALEPARLTEKARLAIQEADGNRMLLVSDISIWEIALLIHKGRLEIDTTPSRFFHLFQQSRNVAIQPITPEIAELSVQFNEEINQDPADRIIAATSIIHSAQLVTADQNLRNSSLVNTVW